MTVLETLLALALVVACGVAWQLHHRGKVEIKRRDRELGEERSRHQNAMEAERKRTAAVFERMIDGIIILDDNEHIQLANRAAATLFDMSDAMVGRTILEATRRHEVAAVVRQLEIEPEVLEHELRIERRGESRLMQINALAMTNPDGIRDGTLLVFRDLTRLRKLESVRQDFVANVSHELRTPLSLIKSAAETLIDGAKNNPPIADRFLDIIDQNTNRLTLLIDDLLLLARLDSGRLDLQVQPVILRAAVEDALSDCALLARAKDVALYNEVPEHVAIEADPDRLRQVLTNLIDNAIKYGRQQGHVTISMRFIGAAHVEIGVRDDGPGISLEAQARVFERFYRVDKARAREHGGTGLGLAIVKNIIEAHGGNVRVESVHGQGTTFYFTLPVAATTR
jgi:two-component system phosphate regulon sensor histidine kinase PhoR